MDLSLLEAIGGYGVGALFGMVMFFIYRLDRKASEKRWQDMLEVERDMLDRDIKTREANTAVLAELKTLIKSINGHRR